MRSEEGTPTLLLDLCSLSLVNQDSGFLETIREWPNVLLSNILAVLIDQERRVWWEILILDINFHRLSFPLNCMHS